MANDIRRCDSIDDNYQYRPWTQLVAFQVRLLRRMGCSKLLRDSDNIGCYCHSVYRPQELLADYGGLSIDLGNMHQSTGKILKNFLIRDFISLDGRAVNLITY